MNNITFSHNGKNYIRVSKKKAEALILKGKTIICAPSNLRPFGAWGAGALIDKKELNKTYNWLEPDIDIIHYWFTQFCNSFIFYNCNNEAGRYINFYVEE